LSLAQYHGKSPIPEFADRPRWAVADAVVQSECRRAGIRRYINAQGQQRKEIALASEAPAPAAKKPPDAQRPPPGGGCLARSFSGSGGGGGCSYHLVGCGAAASRRRLKEVNMSGRVVDFDGRALPRRSLRLIALAAAKAPTAEASKAKEPVAVAKKPVAKNPAAKKAVAQKPLAKAKAKKLSQAKKPVAKKPAAKKPVAQKPLAKARVKKLSQAKKPVAKKPAAKKPVAAKKDVAQKPLAKAKAKKLSQAKKPVAKKHAAKKSVAKTAVDRLLAKAAAKGTSVQTNNNITPNRNQPEVLQQMFGSLLLNVYRLGRSSSPGLQTPDLAEIVRSIPPPMTPPLG
ncbi:unnamed protein product, partial [Polarella glacialis]